MHAWWGHAWWGCAPPCRVFPGELKKILEWFRDYKIPDGKPANKFGYDNKALNKEFTLKVRSPLGWCLRACRLVCGQVTLSG